MSSFFFNFEHLSFVLYFYFSFFEHVDTYLFQEGCSKYQPALNWITQMHFVVEADALILASTDGSIGFFDIARGAVVRTFDGHAGTKTGNFVICYFVILLLVVCFKWAWAVLPMRR